MLRNRMSFSDFFLWSFIHLNHVFQGPLKGAECRQVNKDMVPAPSAHNLVQMRPKSKIKCCEDSGGQKGKGDE